MQGTMPGERRQGRPHTAWMNNFNIWTGLTMEESIRMTEDTDKCRKYVHGVGDASRDRVRYRGTLWPTLGSRTAKERNQTSDRRAIAAFSSALRNRLPFSFTPITGNHECV